MEWLSFYFLIYFVSIAVPIIAFVVMKLAILTLIIKALKAFVSNLDNDELHHAASRPRKTYSWFRRGMRVVKKGMDY